MRFRHPDGSTVHLAYCTNVHPTDTLAGVLDALDRYAVPVRDALGVRRLGVGLWLARDAVTELLSTPDGVPRLAAALADRGLEVVTLNAFPYRAFGAEVVKGEVYRPDWTSVDRLRYTLDCARVLAGLLPADAAYGSVSTLPLAWREPWDDDPAGRRGEAPDRADRRPGGAGGRGPAGRSGSGWSRSRAAWWRPPRRPPRGSRPVTGSGSAWMPAISRSPSRSRPPRSAGSPRPGCRW